MSAVADTAQGTAAGEPAQPVAAPSAAAPSEPTQAAPATQPTTPAVDWSTVDPETLPKDFIAKVEQRKAAHLDADYTRKAQAVADERRQLAEERRRMDDMLSRLVPANTPPDEIAQLRERIKQGEYDLIPELNEKQIRQAIAPIQAQTELQQAVETAQRLHPWVKEKEPEITAILSQNPELQRVAFSNPSQNLPIVLQGIAISLEREALANQLKAERESRAQAVQEAVKAELAKLTEQAKSLPTKTSLAGGTPSGVPADDFARLSPAQRLVKVLESQGKPVERDLREMAAKGR